MIREIKYIVVLLFLFLGKISHGQTVAVIPTHRDSGNPTNGSLNPDIIDSLEELLYITENSSMWGLGVYFLQTQDIDASETQYWDDIDDDGDGNDYNDPNDATSVENDQGWLPIGTSTFEGFKANYIGGYYRIVGLKIIETLQITKYLSQNQMEHELFIRFFINFSTPEKIFQPNEQI